MAQSLDHYPDLLTIDEAGEYLRISRALGYQLARQYRITDGAAGLPVIRLGRCLRVPKEKLAQLTRCQPREESADARPRYVGRSPA